MNQDNYSLTFCSNDHARIGITRWEEKKKLGIKPGRQVRHEDPTDEYVGDNMEEVDNE